MTRPDTITHTYIKYCNSVQHPQSVENRSRVHTSLSPIPIEKGSCTKRMFHYCAHCNYKSDNRWCVRRHQSRKHKTPYDEVVEHPLPIQQPMDLDLMEDSIQVFKIFKLLQRMRNKWCMQLYELIWFKYKNGDLAQYKTLFKLTQVLFISVSPQLSYRKDI